MSLVVFGSITTLSLESRWHLDKSCFLKATLAPFQLQKPLVMNALSRVLLLRWPSL